MIDFQRQRFIFNLIFALRSIVEKEQYKNFEILKIYPSQNFERTQKFLKFINNMENLYFHVVKNCTDSEFNIFFNFPKNLESQNPPKSSKI